MSVTVAELWVQMMPDRFRCTAMLSSVEIFARRLALEIIIHWKVRLNGKLSWEEDSVDTWQGRMEEHPQRFAYFI